PAGNLDRRSNLLHLALSQFLHPSQKIDDPFAAVLDPSLCQYLPPHIKDAGLVLLGGPIHSHVEAEFTFQSKALLSDVVRSAAVANVSPVLALDGANSPRDFRLRATRTRRYSVSGAW